MSLDDALYDRAGQPIDFARWVMLFSDPRYQVLRQTQVGKMLISTVWLGTDLEIEEEPMIFETVVFGARGPGGECWRYSTEARALEHHEELRVQAELLAPLADPERDHRTAIGEIEQHDE